MVVTRSQLVHVEVTRWYQAISQTVRGARLVGEGGENRKQWVEERLEELTPVFAIDLAGFAVLDDRVHVLVRLAPERVEGWSDREVVERWAQVAPPRGKDRRPVAVTRAWVRKQAGDAAFVRQARDRLAELGWFMKCVKEPVARRANRQDGCSGAFWRGRYKPIAVLDDAALLASAVYIDLKPLLAGQAKTAAGAPHTSLRRRVEHARHEGKLAGVRRAAARSAGESEPSPGRAGGHWLCPLGGEPQRAAGRACLLEGLSLESYLDLVNWTSRLLRGRKARPSGAVVSILDGLQTTVEAWQTTMNKLSSRPRELGVAFAFHRGRLREAAERRGCRHLANLNACKAEGQAVSVRHGTIGDKPRPR